MILLQLDKQNKSYDLLKIVHKWIICFIPPALQTPLEETEDETVIPPTEFYVGEEKGIQGHYNSCYLDSTLFSLFALSNEFDKLFLGAKQATPTQQEFSKLIANKIVNPLRK